MNRKKVVKVEPKILNTWNKIFSDWSRVMDNLYDEKDRNDATRWGENPAYWMEPYNDTVFEAWLAHDSRSPSPRWDVILHSDGFIR